MDDKISIIIPVYNTSSYLGKAIESTLNQTYQNIEIIIIDDGSTDGSDAICDEYASKYSNISVIHSPNQGVSAARSKGIERATGDYVMFVDSDDWIEDTICDVLLSAMHKYRAESAMCGYVREYPSNSLPKYIFNENRVMSGTEIQQILCGPLSEQLKAPENIDCLNCIPFKLYPLHAVKKAKMIDIKEVGTAEDLLFNLDAFGHISSCVYVNKPLYHYRKNVETSITTAYKPDLPEKWNRLFEKIKEYINNNKLPKMYDDALENRVAISAFNLSLNAILDQNSLVQKNERIKCILNEGRRKIALGKIKTTEMPVYWKVFFRFAKSNMSFAILIMIVAANKLKGWIK